VEVEAKTGDTEYLRILRQYIPSLIEEQKPDLIFYQAGVDPLISDRLGHLSLSHWGLWERNMMVYDACSKAGKRLVITMGGGYPSDLEPTSSSFQEVVKVHADVYISAAVHFAKVNGKDVSSWWPPQQ